MAKMDLIFSFILIWCIASTSLLIWQFQSNTELQQQLSANRKINRMEKVKNFTGRMPKDNKKMHHSRIKDQEHLTEIKHKQQHNNMHEKQDRRKISTTVNQFPFTRSLERFKRSESFFLYVVQLSSTSSSGGGADLSPPSPLEWSEVRWKDLVVNWGRNTTFSDLLEMSTPLHNDGKTGSGEGAMQKKLILHCIPKAASTTLRRACYKNQKESCEAIDFPAQQGVFLCH